MGSSPSHTPHIAYVLLSLSPPIAFTILVGSSGLEPPTSRLSGVRSNHLSYEPIQLSGVLSLALGGDERDRTDDPLLAKQVLSQLSYTPMRELSLLLGHVSTPKIKQRLQVFLLADQDMAASHSLPCSLERR